MLTFEDLPVGTRLDLGTFTLTSAEIIAFAREFDPQPFHVDPEAAAAGPFGGLIASGWHTAAKLMRLYADVVLADADSRGSPGVADLRWLKPVRPGDVISVSVSVIDAWVSKTRSGRGTVVLSWEGRDAADAVVVTMRGRGMFGTRAG